MSKSDFSLHTGLGEYPLPSEEGNPAAEAQPGGVPSVLAAGSACAGTPSDAKNLAGGSITSQFPLFPNDNTTKGPNAVDEVYAFRILHERQTARSYAFCMCLALICKGSVYLLRPGAAV